LLGLRERWFRCVARQFQRCPGIESHRYWSAAPFLWKAKLGVAGKAGGVYVSEGLKDFVGNLNGFEGGKQVDSCPGLWMEPGGLCIFPASPTLPPAMQACRGSDRDHEKERSSLGKSMEICRSVMTLGFELQPGCKPLYRR
jgi:hypothetical protein